MKLTSYSHKAACDYLAEHQANFPYALITCYSEVTLGAAEQPSDWAQVMEARFFGKSAELHFYRSDNDLAAVLCEDEPNDTVLDRKAKLDTNWRGTLYLRQYLDFDEDGQGRTSYVRLSNLEVNENAK